MEQPSRRSRSLGLIAGVAEQRPRLSIDKVQAGASRTLHGVVPFRTGPKVMLNVHARPWAFENNRLVHAAALRAIVPLPTAVPTGVALMPSPAIRSDRAPP